MAFLLIASIRPLHLLRIGQQDVFVKAASNLLAIIPAVEGILFALRFCRLGSAVVFIIALAMMRFAVSTGTRFSVLLRTFQLPPEPHSYTAADLLQAERATGHALLSPAVAIITTVILDLGFMRSKSTLVEIETCVLFLLISELVDRVLDQRPRSLIGFCSAELIYCSPLLLAKVSALLHS